jgi:hypothetical protein
VIKKLGHQRGGSHSKKKFDKYYGRNFYAKELRDPNGNYRQRIIQNETEDKITKQEILKELEIDD